MRDLKKDGKHIYKYDAGYCSWHGDQDVGLKTDESRLISQLQQETFIIICFKGNNACTPEGKLAGV